MLPASWVPRRQDEALRGAWTLAGAEPALGSFRDGAKVTQDTEGKHAPPPKVHRVSGHAYHVSAAETLAEVEW